ncbi:hypothetical protein BD410DRAFT_781782 [Rickenella mellea]|uniref:Uncharacterized protein n=1 Tax=Rickenella mellea TaxID=50990 RepID=A0A4Y7QJN5_9AGAM|nr:hypothetical protein BD410DRAFT_781782 [Rickenella mellea]
MAGLPPTGNAPSSLAPSLTTPTGGSPSPTSSQPPATTSSALSGQPPISSLYIYVFTTFVALILIAIAIILRACILRRRWRRRVAAAIAAGEPIPEVDYRGDVVLARGAFGRGKAEKDVGVRPDFHHVFFVDGDVGREKADNTIGEKEWRDIKPVSVTLLSNNAVTVGSSPTPPPQRRSRPLRWLTYVLQMFSSADSSTPTPSPVPSPNPSLPKIAPPTKPSPPGSRTIQASFFISMPSHLSSMRINSNSAVEDGVDIADGDCQEGEGDDVEKAKAQAQELPPLEIGVVAFNLNLPAVTPSASASRQQ